MQSRIGRARLALSDAGELEPATDERRHRARAPRLFGHELVEIEGASEPRIAGAEEAERREPQSERHRRIEELDPDIAIEPRQILELDRGRVGALDGEVGLREPIGEPGDDLHFPMGDKERKGADFRVPHFPAGPAQNGEANRDQDQVEAEIVVDADRAPGAGRSRAGATRKSRHGQRSPG